MEGSALCKRKGGVNEKMNLQSILEMNSKTTYPWRQWKGKGTGKY